MARRGGQRSFCPVIRIKCSKRSFSRGGDNVGAGGRSKAAAFKAAKAKLRKAYGLGNVHPHAEMTSLPKAAVTKVAHAAANPAGSCTVSMGGRTFKRKGAAVGQKVAELIRTLKSGGCCSPKIQRG